MRARPRPGQTRQGARQARDPGGPCLCAPPWNLGLGEAPGTGDPSVLRRSAREGSDPRQLREAGPAALSWARPEGP